MIIEWREDGGVKLLDLSKQEFDWLKKHLLVNPDPTKRDGGDALAESIRTAVPVIVPIA